MTVLHEPNAQYNLATPESLAVRAAAHVRTRMYARFIRNTAIRPDDTLLDVGATTDQTYPASNYIEAWYPQKDKVTAVGLDDAAFLERLYPGITYVRADGRDLPFQSASFDIVHSSAVLEHVGSFSDQQRFVSELTRVARRTVFMTTPNRWFPVEFHTLLPLLHWLPKPWFRRILTDTRYHFYSLERNLNLLDRRDLSRLCVRLGECTVHIESIRLLGLPSNLLVTIRKSQDPHTAREADSRLGGDQHGPRTHQGEQG
jgi:Methyltransferase domain